MRLNWRRPCVWRSNWVEVGAGEEKLNYLGLNGAYKTCSFCSQAIFGLWASQVKWKIVVERVQSYAEVSWTYRVAQKVSHYD